MLHRFKQLLSNIRKLGKGLRNIRYKPNQNELLDAVKRMRQGETKLTRGKPQAFRESVARELIARQYVLPELRKILGGKMVALLLSGSAQTGIRKTTLAGKNQTEKSDLDLILIISEPKWGGEFIVDSSPKLVLSHESHNQIALMRVSIQTLAESLEKTFGFPLHMATYDTAEFEKHYKPTAYNENILAHQTVYGQKWMDEFRGRLTPNWKKGMPGLKKSILKNTPKYRDRN